MRDFPPRMLIAGAFLLLCSHCAHAGMPSLTIDDIVYPSSESGLSMNALSRLQNISFFLLGFLASAYFIKLLWNYLGKDWTFLPRLSYGKALGMVFLWGLMFILVLTMISGARELMTPGAWKRDGLTYKLKKPATPPNSPTLYDPREERLMELRRWLMRYAEGHDEQYPDDKSALKVDAKLWQAPHPSGLKYIYQKGLRFGKDEIPLVLEPDIFGEERYVLFTNGDVRKVRSGELKTLLAAKQP